MNEALKNDNVKYNDHQTEGRTLNYNQQLLITSAYNMNTLNHSLCSTMLTTYKTLLRRKIKRDLPIS